MAPGLLAAGEAASGVMFTSSLDQSMHPFTISSPHNRANGHPSFVQTVNRWIRLPLVWLCLALGSGLTASASAEPQVELLPSGLEARQLAIVVNDEDDMSVRIGEYYRERRGIPPENVIHVRFPATSVNLPRDRFRPIREEVERQTPYYIQAYALAWTKPYRVDCMSITSAMTLGFDAAYCSAERCGKTRPSGYYNSASAAPFSDYKLRPSMLLAEIGRAHV